MALYLGQNFPHKYRSCSLISQAYFLSATDLDGEPYVWDRVMRLEQFGDALSQVKDMTGIDLRMRTENPSGDSRLKKMYFDAVFSDLQTLCSVCKVYAQDFECLGYVKPDRCTPHLCATVNVTLDYWEENLSSEFESGWRQAELESLSSEFDSLSSGKPSYSSFDSL